MKKTSCLLLACASCQLYAHDDWSLNNHWNLTADFVYLKRNYIHNERVVVDTTHPHKRLDTKSLVTEFDFEPGYRVSLIYAPNKKAGVEATYMTAKEWRAQKITRDTASLSYPFENSNYTTDYTMADKAKAKYKSAFHNAELNYWAYITARRADYFSVSGIIGARYFQLDESFNLKFYRGTDASNYRVHATDNLYGPQLGGDILINPAYCIMWELVAKVAPMLNHMHQRTFLGDDNNTVTLHDFHKNTFNFTLLVDVEGILTFQWTANLNLHAGYKVMYLNGMALAPEQISRDTSHNSGKRVKDGGIILIQGLTAGLTMSF